MICLIQQTTLEIGPTTLWTGQNSLKYNIPHFQCNIMQYIDIIVFDRRGRIKFVKNRVVCNRITDVEKIGY